MVTESSVPSYLLKVTLVGTADPVIFRHLSVPVALQFDELHEAIVAAFGWNARGYNPCNSWVFRNWSADPINHIAAKHAGLRSIYFTHPGKDFGIEPSMLHTSTKIEDMLSNEDGKLLKFWTYDYNISRHRHAIEVLRIEKDGKDEISCLGGQGHIEHNAWQFGNLRGTPEVVKTGASNLDMEMAQLSARMKVVQDDYRDRKTDEMLETAQKVHRPMKRRYDNEGPGESSNIKRGPASKKVKRET